MIADDLFPLERLMIEPMASGERSLRLTEQVSWEDFPRYASTLVTLLGGSVNHQADSPAERVWTVVIRGALFWLTFDDFPFGVSLDSQDARASSAVIPIRDALLAYRSQREAAG
jgi:hypothetical protein